MRKYRQTIVITTINEKTEGIREFEQYKDWHIVLVGDRKSVPIESSDNLTFLSWEQQCELDFEFARLCPFNHYARKNIGYLYAISKGAKIIYDTDDDNIPCTQTWRLPEFRCNKNISSDTGFVNIYGYFSDELIWPRGLPLDEIHTHYGRVEDLDTPASIGIWQGLADEDPDVDAIFRLAFKKDIYFRQRDPVGIAKDTYVPTNSQNTFWHSSAFPYLYLPALVSFRATDIYRGYLAQKLMWHYGQCLGFTGATVIQKRNMHDLMQDFRDEFECYFNIKKMINIMDAVSLQADPHASLKLLYEALVVEGLVQARELDLLLAWQNDFRNMMGAYAHAE